MKSLAMSVAFLAAGLMAPSLAGAAAPAGLWVTLKNECHGVASANVADQLCSVKIGSATFMRAVLNGDVPPGFTVKLNLCADSSGGGQIQFAPTKGATTPVGVSVKADGTVVYPPFFCKK